MLKKIYRALRTRIKRLSQKDSIGFNFEIEFTRFNLLDKYKKLSCNWEDIYPCLSDNTKTTNFDAHYIYHPAWAARIVKQINPEKHIDISSTLHFCSILSAFIPVEFYDFRPAHLNLNQLISGKGDLTQLPFETNSIKSISCMHTVEHIGLGRYGDPIDPDGDVKAINELKRVVKPSGNLLFVVPVGRPRIAFNAHRIYTPNMIVDLFEGFKLEKFSLVTDTNDFIDISTLAEGEKQTYGCGCFWFIKI